MGSVKVRSLILAKNPGAIINGRLQGFGDYATPEQNIPVETPAAPAWELCMTIGDQWGWQPWDTGYKSTHDLIAIFADVVGHGGNLLVDIGPRRTARFRRTGQAGGRDRRVEREAWRGHLRHARGLAQRSLLRAFNVERGQHDALSLCRTALAEARRSRGWTTRSSRWKSWAVDGAEHRVVGKSAGARCRGWCSSTCRKKPRMRG